MCRQAALTLEPTTPWYVLIEAANVRQEEVEEALMSALESGRRRRRDRRPRTSRRRLDSGLSDTAISESQKKEGASLKHDVSVPVDSMPEFIAEATGAVEDLLPGTRVVAFGHVRRR